MTTENLCDKYNTLMDLYNLNIKNYNAEKKANNELKMKVSSINRELEEQREVNELHKKAYDDLVLALTPHIKVNAENLVHTVDKQTPEELINQNTKLKEHIKLLYLFLE